MGTPLTGSTVASTYTGLLKTSDNSALTSVLKAIGDGSGIDSALQVSTAAVNTTGDFSVGANKLTVAAASGNTVVGGSLTVTGATSLSGNLAIPGNLSVTGTSTLTGAASVASTLAVTGATSLSSLSTSGAATIGTTLGVTGASTLASLGVTGATTLASVGVTGAATVGTTLDVTGAATLSNNLTVNGDTTIGNAGTDLLTINANAVTLPNLTPVTVDLANDKVLITDASDTSKLRSIAASALGINASNAPQIKQTLYQDSTAGGSPFVATSAGSGTEITVLTTTITPRSTASTVLVTIAVNYSATNIQFGALRITRNGTEIGSNNIGSNLYGIAPFTGISPYSSEFFSSQFIQILDSPNLATAVTYKIHLYATGPTTFPSMWVNKTYQDVLSGTNSSSSARVSSSMTLQEYFA